MMFAGAPNYLTVSRSVSGAVPSMAAGRHVSSPSQLPCHGFVVGSSLSLWKSCLVGATALMVRERSARRPQSKKRGFFKKNEKRALHKSGEVLSTGTLPVGDGFELYYEEHGQKDGIPVVFLHGGPGAGSSRRMAQLFDPSKYRIVLFDQRGCGKSVRNASTTAEEQLDDNTTWHHVSDLEVLRTHLKIDRWVVAGGSWGTCLALAYASRFKERVLAMALRAVFLFRREELEFFCGSSGGASSLAPAAWRSFSSWLPSGITSAEAVAAAFRRAALGKDESISPSDALGKWRAWENHLFSLRERNPKLGTVPSTNTVDFVDLSDVRPPKDPWPKATKFNIQALLTLHYVAERGFLQGTELLDAAAEFNFPLKLIHGQCDCICPAENARTLASAVGSNAELLLTNAGHSQWDAENIDAFVRATDEIASDCLVTC
mgnify:CR=1 FL=1